MYIKYKKSYLTDGTKVKITHELFNQFKKWEVQGIVIEDKYKDELKMQDNNWINSYRGYYSQFTSIGLIGDKDTNKLFNDNTRKESMVINNTLKECTKLQRERFINHFILGYSCSEISQKENKSLRSIQYSIKKVKTKINNALRNE